MPPIRNSNVSFLAGQSCVIRASYRKADTDLTIMCDLILHTAKYVSLYGVFSIPVDSRRTEQRACLLGVKPCLYLLSITQRFPLHQQW